MPTYRVRRSPRYEIRRIRGLDLHLTRWGPQDAEQCVVLLHGWQDTGDTFQFMVDAFQRDRPFLSFDWRGFGRSEWPQEGYWFADYYGDLEALLDELLPTGSVRLVGHSMGGNIACVYAGLRPERVRCVVNLEGCGMPRTTSAGAAGQLRKWLDQLKTPMPSKDYESFEQLAKVVAFRYPRFSPEQADYIARAWGRREAGRVHLLGDPRHRMASPLLYKRDDAEAIWRGVTAPVLLCLGEESEHWPALGADGTDHAFRASFRDIEIERVAGAGHMLHIEKADEVASVIEKFLDAH